MTPVYASFVYIDTICALFPGQDRLTSTQSSWEARRENHLGHAYEISPRQLWFTRGVQRMHTLAMCGSSAMPDRARLILDGPTALPLNRVISEIRTSLEELKAWGACMGVATRAVVQAVEAYWALFGEFTRVYDEDDHFSGSFGLDSFSENRTPILTLGTLCQACTRDQGSVLMMRVMRGMVIACLTLGTLCLTCALHRSRGLMLEMAARPLMMGHLVCTTSSKSATKHISVDAFGQNYDTTTGATIDAAQHQPVSSVGSGIF
ncbi:hypothetical protein CYMTET_41649 [Cymbomonas tetramitiformis]|uniref:Uncharacterized protein n=1 Tax=Cymbomonas tetramitiformis TaxID=36881 RepID=A0AAE0C5N3_9CHLO|nr:hypothetical protein CYMTET_41649 [Cymbomonas tetramitiformis]